MKKIIGLPNGINTPLNKQVYDNGTEFSGGEMQKLILAKALYKKFTDFNFRRTNFCHGPYS